jgi:hypothetical protein
MAADTGAGLKELRAQIAAMIPRVCNSVRWGPDDAAIPLVVK